MLYFITFDFFLGGGTSVNINNGLTWDEHKWPKPMKLEFFQNGSFKGALWNILRAVNKQKNGADTDWYRNGSLEELTWLLDVL